MQKLKDIFNKVSVWDRVQGAIFGGVAGFVMSGGHPLPTILLAVAGIITGGTFLSNVFAAATFGHDFAFARVASNAATRITGGRSRAPKLGSPELA